MEAGCSWPDPRDFLDQLERDHWRCVGHRLDARFRADIDRSQLDAHRRRVGRGDHDALRVQLPVARQSGVQVGGVGGHWRQRWILDGRCAVGHLGAEARGRARAGVDEDEPDAIL